MGKALNIYIVAIEADIDIGRNRVAEVVHGADSPFAGYEALWSNDRLRTFGSSLAECRQNPVGIGIDYCGRAVLQDVRSGALQCAFFCIVVEGDVGHGVLVLSTADVFCTKLVFTNVLTVGNSCGGAIDGTLYPSLIEPIAQSLDVDVTTIEDYLDAWGKLLLLAALEVYILCTVNSVPSLNSGIFWWCYQYITFCTSVHLLWRLCLTSDTVDG